jgi:hypothetical protein
MRTLHLPALLLVLAPLFVSYEARAEGPEFATAIGAVDKFEKETLTISVGEKIKKTLDLKVTGTSKVHLLAPQVRAGKTVVTQRAAEVTDLTPKQPIAVIYTQVDKEFVLLTAVIKSMEKEKK